jgi:hypothetical protein
MNERWFDMKKWDPSLLYAVLGSKKTEDLIERALEKVDREIGSDGLPERKKELPLSFYPSLLMQFDAFKARGGMVYTFENEAGWDVFLEVISSARFLVDKCLWRAKLYQKYGLRLYFVGCSEITTPAGAAQLVAVFFGSDESLLLYQPSDKKPLQISEAGGVAVLRDQRELLLQGQEEKLADQIGGDDFTESQLREFVEKEGGQPIFPYDEVPVVKSQGDKTSQELISRWHRIFGSH